MDDTNRQPAAAPRCWSCDGEIAATDAFCRHCGIKLKSGTAPSRNVHDRLAAVERRLLHVTIGIGASLLLMGWIALQLYHFGRGGILG